MLDGIFSDFNIFQFFCFFLEQMEMKRDVSDGDDLNVVPYTSSRLSATDSGKRQHEISGGGELDTHNYRNSRVSTMDSEINFDLPEFNRIITVTFRFT